MKSNASRLASPLLMTARENRNAAMTSQTAALLYPASACAGVSTPVSIVTVIPIRTAAPPGSGRSMSPSTVHTKMANIHHPWTVIAAGRGMTYRIASATNRRISTETHGGIAGASVIGRGWDLSVTASAISALNRPLGVLAHSDGAHTLRHLVLLHPIYGFEADAVRAARHPAKPLFHLARARGQWVAGEDIQDDRCQDDERFGQ